MIGLGAGLDRRFLDLDEIADAGALPEPRARPQPRKRPNGDFLADMGADEMGEGVNDGAVFDRHFLAEYDVRLDHHVPAECGVRREKDRLRRDERHAGIERGLAQALLQNGFGFGELSFGVDTAHVVLLGFTATASSFMPRAISTASVK